MYDRIQVYAIINNKSGNEGSSSLPSRTPTLPTCGVKEAVAEASVRELLPVLTAASFPWGASSEGRSS